MLEAVSVAVRGFTVGSGIRYHVFADEVAEVVVVVVTMIPKVSSRHFMISSADQTFVVVVVVVGTPEVATVDVEVVDVVDTEPV